MILYPRAKVNLTLSVLKKLPDGYHEIDTVFQPVSLCDRLEIEPCEQEGLLFSCSDPALETEDNLVCRAYRLLRPYREGAAGIRARLEKRIPREAGLGGGSGDAAAMLTGLVRLWKLKLGQKALTGLAQQLGADVPALLFPGASRGRGPGAAVRRIRSDWHGAFLIVKPPEAFSTAAMYRRLDELGVCRSRLAGDRDSRRIREALYEGDTRTIAGWLFNSFEEAVPEEYLAPIREKLKKAGALGALLSGSGSAVCGLFSDAAARDEALRRLSADREVPEDWILLPCEAVNES